MRVIEQKPMFELLCKEFPSFAQAFRAEDDGADEPDEVRYFAAKQMTILLDLVLDALQSENLHGLESLFLLVERLLDEGDTFVRDAVYSCFLEDLIGRAPDEVDRAVLKRLLGPRAKEYWRECWSEQW